MTRISDMTALTALPSSGAMVPVEIGDGANYKYDLTKGIGVEALFVNASALAIPTANFFQSSGYSTLDVGSAVYVHDVAVDAAYVTANPRSSFIEVGGRGFRLSLEQPLDPQMFGADPLGVQDSYPAFAAAIAYVPTGGGDLGVLGGAYKLLTEPTWGSKSIIWDISPAATFTGAGTGGGLFPATARTFDAGLRTDIAASTGAALIGFRLSGTGTVARTAQAKFDEIGHYSDFGIKADGTTDDTAAVQTAFNWCGPGKILIMPSAKVKITSTVTYGNGTTTALSTIGNNCTIIWGGEPSNANALIDTSDPWYSTANSGTHFIWGGASGGTMFKVAGPIQGLRWIGAPTLDGGVVVNGGSGATACFEARSFSSCTFDGIVVVNWQAGGRGALLTTVDSTGIGTVGANSVVSSGNRIGRIFAYSPYGHNGECAKIDGYQAANGEDVTVTEIGMVKCGISGTGAKGLVLGYCDDITIGKLVNTVYGTMSGSPYGLYLAGTTTPFAAPARVYIYNAAVGQGLGVGGSTNAQVVVVNYEMDDAAILPTVTGLFIRNIIWTGHSTNMMAYPSDGKNKSSAVNNGDGYYGLDLSGTHFHSLTRQGSAAHVAANTDVEFEAGATGGPTTGVHFKVTTAGAGYPTGVGGAVTQLTSKATGVTLNKVCGAITMNAAALAANGIVSFPLTNSTIAADDDVRVWVKSGNASVGSYRVAAEGNGAGTRTIVVENKTAGSLSEAVVLGINVLKAVVA